LAILKAFSNNFHSPVYQVITHLRSHRPHFHPSHPNYPQIILRLPQRKRPQTLFIRLPQLSNYHPTHTRLRGLRIHRLRPFLAPMSRTREATHILIGILSQHRL
jgi:hypothetical protein